MKAIRRIQALGAAALAATTLAGCGSSGPSGGGSTRVSRPVTSPAPPAGSGTPASAATKSAVAKAYATLFGTTATLTQATASLQHGGKFVAAIKKESKSSYAQKSGAKVTSVRLVSPNTAKVKFSILVGGSPLLKNQPGYAVKENGHWKVAARTFCGLLKLTNDAPKACDDPSVTALPH